VFSLQICVYEIVNFLKWSEDREELHIKTLETEFQTTGINGCNMLKGRKSLLKETSELWSMSKVILEDQRRV
jgi:hypothetical protein